MNWLMQLFAEPGGVAHAVLMLALVAAAGLALGEVKLRGVGLGVAGVLFAGIAFGHLGARIDPHVMEFARELGLILFVYSIGVQVGPGFGASLRQHGLRLNLLAALVVALGVLLTVVGHYWVIDGDEFPVAVGIYTGAVTNTPSLAAAQQALKDVRGLDPERLKLPGLGYAVAYPFGIIGIILTMVLIRAVFRINPQNEREALKKLGAGTEPLETMSIEVRNPNLDGLKLSQMPVLRGSGAVVSRVLRDGQTMVPRGDTSLRIGDVLLVVGPRSGLDELRLAVGAQSAVDVRQAPGDITARRVLVTRGSALGRTVPELDLGQRFGVTVTRINRGEVELSPTQEMPLKFADALLVVGAAEGIARAAAELGDSLRRLNHPQVIPVFIGIALGVIVGSWPIQLPGMPVPVRLGLAGGPLLVAMVLSRLGNIGPLIWYLPTSANFFLREIGIVLFLACVGLRSGDGFVATLAEGAGLRWMLWGAVVTLVPLLVVGILARAMYKVNYLSLCGFLAGSTTDPPALAFAGAMTGSDAPSVSYATVYPMVMVLRVISAQAMVILLSS